MQQMSRRNPNPQGGRSTKKRKEEQYQEHSSVPGLAGGPSLDELSQGLANRGLTNEEVQQLLSKLDADGGKVKACLLDVECVTAAGMVPTAATRSEHSAANS